MLIPLCVLIISMYNNSHKDTVCDDTLSPYLRCIFLTFFCAGSPLYFTTCFSFVRFIYSNILLLSSKVNVSGFIGVTTCFPGMVPLSIFLNYFIMSATAFSKKQMLAFAKIWLNMTFVATFIKEYVLSFDSCSFMKKICNL